jgi:hypothetical protein
MHHDATEIVRSQTPVLVPSAVDALGEPDRLRLVSPIRELGRVMEQQDQAVVSRHAVAGCLKVAGQNVRLGDPLIGEETIGRLGVGPVLADQLQSCGMRLRSPDESGRRPAKRAIGFQRFPNHTHPDWGGTVTSPGNLCKSAAAATRSEPVLNVYVTNHN